MGRFMVTDSLGPEGYNVPLGTDWLLGSLANGVRSSRWDRAVCLVHYFQEVVNLSAIITKTFFLY